MQRISLGLAHNLRLVIHSVPYSTPDAAHGRAPFLSGYYVGESKTIERRACLIQSHFCSLRTVAFVDHLRYVETPNQLNSLPHCVYIHSSRPLSSIIIIPFLPFSSSYIIDNALNYTQYHSYPDSSSPLPITPTAVFRPDERVSNPSGIIPPTSKRDTPSFAKQRHNITHHLTMASSSYVGDISDEDKQPRKKLDKGKGKMKLSPELPDELWMKILGFRYDEICEGELLDILNSTSLPFPPSLLPCSSKSTSS
jgi:hypothetical protein